MSQQRALFDRVNPMPDPEAKFDGPTYTPARDGVRLTRQLVAVRAYLQDGRWRTLSQIARAVDGSEAGVSARLRDLRKAKFGGAHVERRYVADGLWEYRLEE